MPRIMEVRIAPLFALTLRSKWVCPTAALLALLLSAPVVAHAQSGSPFDTGFTAIQTLFTGTIAKVASLSAIVIGGYDRHTQPITREAALEHAAHIPSHSLGENAQAQSVGSRDGELGFSL